MFCRQKKRHNFGLTDRAASQTRQGHGEPSLGVTGHQLTRESSIAGGFLTLVFPLLPILARVALKTLVGWRHTCRNRASCGFPLAAGAAGPARCRQGFEFPAAVVRRQIRGGAKGNGWGEGETFGGEELCSHPSGCSRPVRSRAAAQGSSPAGTVQPRARLLLPGVASFSFGFTPGFAKGGRVPVMADLCMSPNHTKQDKTVFGPSSGHAW